jgi:hypothetical protein
MRQANIRSKIRRTEVSRKRRRRGKAKRNKEKVARGNHVLRLFF